MTDVDRKLTALEWRLYVVAMLGAVYIVTWRVLGPPLIASNPEVPAVAPIAEPSRAGNPRAGTQRVASPRATTSRAATPRPVRVPALHRARTRSS